MEATGAACPEELEEPTLSSLPTELLYQVQGWLPLAPLLRFAATSRRARQNTFEACDPSLWRDKLDFYASQWADGNGSVRGRLERVDDACFLGILSRIATKPRLGIRSVVLDYTPVTRRTLDALLQLLDAPGSSLSRISLHACSGVFFSELELADLLLRPILKLGVLGTHLISTDTYSQSVIELVDGFQLNHPTGPIDLARFDHAVGSMCHPALLLPACSLCGSTEPRKPPHVERDACPRCARRGHACGDRWRCKVGGGRCRRAGCGRRTGCGSCGEVGCLVHGWPAV
ncbi:hypothetical protein DFJ74DRAFT_679777 [Hyaloraphidium curvatum]|nr:hypothetical protein DFJ74DRAFT_679777 [Hyaloraphidium curvatum]